jgi:DNA-binding MarR family transcriptional regulator
MPEARDADAELFAAVQTFHRAMAEVVHPMFDEVGVTNGQFFLLFFIEKMPRPTVGSIADQLGVQMSTVTHLLNNVEARGLVRRERSSEDRRVVRLVVTSRGSKLLARIEGHLLDQVRSASSGIDDGKKAAATRLLNEISSRIRGAQSADTSAQASLPSPAPKKKPVRGDRR